jgi:hypothetical protein
MKIKSDILTPIAHSVEGVLQIVPCGRTTVFAAISSGALKARKIGRRTIILDDDLRSWLMSLPSKHVEGCQTPSRSFSERLNDDRRRNDDDGR